MKSTNIWFLSLILIVVLSIIGWTVYAQRTSQRQAWEYKCTGAMNEQKLNELGDQGWELVAVTGDYVYCLKRAK